MFFEHAVEVLDDVAPALLGHGRHGDADELAVGLRVEAEVGGLDAFSISLMTLGSHGWMRISWASGAETWAICVTGVWVP